MTGIETYISAIESSLAEDSPRAYIAMLIFEDEAHEDYSVSALPYAFEQPLTFDRAFEMQSVFQRTIERQEALGVSYSGKQVGVLVQDPASFETAELLAEALLGAVRGHAAVPYFAYAADARNWVDIISGNNGHLAQAEV